MLTATIFQMYLDDANPNMLRASWKIGIDCMLSQEQIVRQIRAKKYEVSLFFLHICIRLYLQYNFEDELHRITNKSNGISVNFDTYDLPADFDGSRLCFIDVVFYSKTPILPHLRRTGKRNSFQR